MIFGIGIKIIKMELILIRLLKGVIGKYGYIVLNVIIIMIMVDTVLLAHIFMKEIDVAIVENKINFIQRIP